jgi:hypothetical protein
VPDSVGEPAATAALNCDTPRWRSSLKRFCPVRHSRQRYKRNRPVKSNRNTAMPLAASATAMRFSTQCRDQVHRSNLRMTSDLRRQLILSAAKRCFARHGFAGTTTKSVAAAAAISEGLLFKHFPSKSALAFALASSLAVAQSSGGSSAGGSSTSGGPAASANPRFEVREHPWSLAEAEVAAPSHDVWL